MQVKLSGRTAARLFVRQTGLTFGQWRQQLRLLSAMEYLGTGESVTSGALEVGYKDVSAFIAAFKKDLWRHPGALLCLIASGSPYRWKCAGR